MFDKRISPDIQLFSGNSFYFNDPKNSCFDITDIAHALSNICRYTGHTRVFYSVAQHSIAVSLIVPPEHALAGLLHDAAEAFIGDVSRPLKNLLPDYRIIEDRVERAVLMRYGLNELPPCVKEADIVMLLATEQRDLMHPADWALLDGIEPLMHIIVPIDPPTAEFMFLQRFFELTGRGD
jgi:hypothetical protein